MNELKVQIKQKFTSEANFTTLWLKELKALWYAVDKISDWWIGMKKIDVYLTSDSNSYACEVKIIDWNTFALNKIRDNQWSYLLHLNNLKWWLKPILCVASKKNQKYVIFSFDRIKDYDRKTTSLQLTFE